MKKQNIKYYLHEYSNYVYRKTQEVLWSQRTGAGKDPAHGSLALRWHQSREWRVADCGSSWGPRTGWLLIDYKDSEHKFPSTWSGRAWSSMWACFCWLPKSRVCCLILETMPSCPGLTPTRHSTNGLTAGSAEHSPLHQWRASHGGHLHFKERTSSKSANTFNNNNRMWCLFLIWWHLTSLKWTGATPCTLTMDIMWLLTLLLVLFLLFAPCIWICF